MHTPQATSRQLLPFRGARQFSFRLDLLRLASMPQMQEPDGHSDPRLYNRL